MSASQRVTIGLAVLVTLIAGSPSMATAIGLGVRTETLPLVICMDVGDGTCPGDMVALCEDGIELLNCEGDGEFAWCDPNPGVCSGDVEAVVCPFAGCPRT